MMNKVILLIFCCASFSAIAQSHIHPEMDQVDAVTSEIIDENYVRFATAYSRLDAKMISETFHDKGSEYYIGFPGKVPVINYGKAAIFINMNKDFVAAHSRNHKLKVNFRLVERKTDGEKVYDVGYYQVTVDLGKEIINNYGKFAIVLTKGTDHQWKFMTDINSPATQEEYEQVGYLKEINENLYPITKN